MNQALLGAVTPVLGVQDIGSFNWQVNTSVPQWSVFMADLMGMGNSNLPASLNKVAAAGRAIQNASGAISTLQGASRPELIQGAPSRTLAHQLSQVAMMILGGVPCQTYTTATSGFDTHGSQAYQHWERLGALDAALRQFFSIIEASERAEDVVVLITSEFGRQVKENAGLGTDHGRATSAILVGGGVRGGLYGEMPSLAPEDLDLGAMKPTVDFRSLYATILNRLGGDPSITRAVLGVDALNNDFEDLGVFG